MMIIIVIIVNNKNAINSGFYPSPLPAYGIRHIYDNSKVRAHFLEPEKKRQKS